MATVEKILDERGKTHGDFRDQFRVAQCLKTAMCTNSIDDAVIREGAEMLCLKMSRVAAGDETEIDHWRDIAGYAKLIVTHLEETGK